MNAFTMMTCLTIALAITLSACSATKRAAAIAVVYSKDESILERDSAALVQFRTLLDEFKERADDHETRSNTLHEASRRPASTLATYRSRLDEYGERIKEVANDYHYWTTNYPAYESFFEEADVDYLVDAFDHYEGQYPDSLLARGRALDDRYASILSSLRHDRIDMIARWDSTQLARVETRLSALESAPLDRSAFRGLSLAQVSAVRDSAHARSQRLTAEDSPLDLVTLRLRNWKDAWTSDDDSALAERSPRSSLDTVEALEKRWDEAIESAASDYVLANAILGERIRPLRERAAELKEHPRTVKTATALLSGPAFGSAPVGDLNDGMKVYKLDAREGWVKVGIEPARLDYTACESPRDVDAQFTRGWLPASALELPRDWTYYAREDRLHSSALNDPGVRLCLTRIYDKLVVNLEGLQNTCNAALMAYARNEQMMVTWQVDDGQSYTARWTWFGGVSISGSAALCMTDPEQFLLLNAHLAAGRKISFRVEGAFGECRLQFSCMGFRRAADIAFENWGVGPVDAR